MTEAARTDRKSLLSELPSITEVLESAAARAVAAAVGERCAAAFARDAVETLRAGIVAGRFAVSRSALLADAEHEVTRRFEEWTLQRMPGVINATGVIIHTNLGRAPLSEAAKIAMADAAGYAAVEMDLLSGKRGPRGGNIDRMLCELTAAEDAMVVNNCAAAALLVLSVLSAGREVIISRGELVEIGGDFRVPDVLERSGGILREVGTTNRTKLADYERAITERTAMILRVHPSNYRITGFTAKPENAELAGLAHDRGIIFFEDAGSGALVDLSEFGLADEPLIPRSIADGADIVTFSGDKLLGGPQCGIIAGRAELVGRIRRHPLYRALRTDKITYAALGATLEAYMRGTALTEIPVLRMIATHADVVARRTESVAERLKKVAGTGWVIEVSESDSVVGGGSAPGVNPRTRVIEISHPSVSADRIAGKLRTSPVPVVARIADGRVLIDLRAVFETQEDDLIEQISQVFSRET